LKRPNGTEIRALFILSIIVPVGLVASFRLTGILKEPPELERITLEPVTLTLQRPSGTLEGINGSAQNVWTQEEASITAGIYICSYLEGASCSPFYGHDGVTFNTYVNVSLAKGRINTAQITFRPLDGNAVLLVSEERWSLRLENATLISLHYWGTNETDAYIKASVLNLSCSVSDQIFWVFLDENESHELEITVEVAHTRENAIKIVTIPIELRMVPSGES